MSFMNPRVMHGRYLTRKEERERFLILLNVDGRDYGFIYKPDAEKDYVIVPREKTERMRKHLEGNGIRERKIKEHQISLAENCAAGVKDRNHRMVESWLLAAIEGVPARPV